MTCIGDACSTYFFQSMNMLACCLSLCHSHTTLGTQLEHCQEFMYELPRREDDTGAIESG